MDMQHEQNIYTTRQLDQILTLGQKNNNKLKNMNIFVYGLDTIGVQVVKNIVLLGIKQVCVCDDEHVTARDGGFMVGELEVGRIRSQVYLEYFCGLNAQTKVYSSTLSYFQQNPSKFNCLIVLNLHNKSKLQHLNNICSSQSSPIHFITAGNFGFLFYQFIHFHNPSKPTQKPKNLEECYLHRTGVEYFNQAQEKDECDDKIYYVRSYSDGRVMGMENREFQDLCDGDQVKLEEFKEANQLNGKIFNIKKIAPNHIQLINAPKINTNQGLGTLQKITPQPNICHNSLQHFSQNPQHKKTLNQLTNNNEPTKQQNLQQIIIHLMGHYQKYGRYAKLNVNQQVQEILQKIKKYQENWESQHEESYRNIIKRVIKYLGQEVMVLDVLWGGLVAHKIVNIVTNSISRHQWNIRFFEQLIPNHEHTNQSEMANQNNTCYAQIYGQKFVQQASKTKVLIAGAGGRGCQIAKICANMNIGLKDKGGVIQIADQNILIQQNLLRHSLFREQHIGHNKSILLCSQSTKINPQCNFQPITVNLTKQMDQLQSQKLWKETDILIYAIDTKRNENWFSERSVQYEKPLIHIGVKEQKCTVYPVLPFESCTLAEYPVYEEQYDFSIQHAKQINRLPYKFKHIVSKANNYFEQIFVSPFKQIQQLYTNRQHKIQSWLTKINRNQPLRGLDIISKILQLYSLSSYESLVDYAIEQFYNQFHNNITMFLFHFPSDKYVEQLNKLYWEVQQRRIPHPIQFDIQSEMHLNFVRNMVNLYAEAFGIQKYSHDMLLDTIKQLLKQKKNRYIVDPVLKSTTQTQDKQNKQQCSFIQSISNFEYSNKKMPKYTEFSREQKSMKKEEMEFIYSFCCIRADNYNIKKQNKLNAMRYTYMMTPKLVTTISVASALAGIQLLKLIYNKTLSKNSTANNLKHNNYCTNLSIPYYLQFQSSPSIFQKSKQYDPIMCGPVQTVPSDFSSWNKIHVFGPMKICEFKEKIQKNYGVNVNMIIHGIYALYFKWGHNKDKQNIDKDIREVVQGKSKRKVVKEWIMLSVAASRGHGDQIDCLMPQIRYYI